MARRGVPALEQAGGEQFDLDHVETRPACRAVDRAQAAVVNDGDPGFGHARRAQRAANPALQVAGLSLSAFMLSTSSLLIGAFRLIPLGGIGDMNHLV